MEVDSALDIGTKAAAGLVSTKEGPLQAALDRWRDVLFPSQKINLSEKIPDVAQRVEDRTTAKVDEPHAAILPGNDIPEVQITVSRPEVPRIVSNDVML